MSNVFMKKYAEVTLAGIIFCNICLAQVPVSREPRHHNVFENGHIRILDVHIPPGDTSRIHIHATPSLFVVLKNAKTGSQVISEEDHSNSPVPRFGNIWFEGFYMKPRIHRVWNSDTTEFNVMDIELTNKNYRAIDPPIKQESFTFLFDEKPVRAYRFNLRPAAKNFVLTGKADVLMLLLTNSVDSVLVNEKSFANKGEFIYIASGKNIEMKNNGRVTAEFAYFELK
jgi:hypothetical protein